MVLKKHITTHFNKTLILSSIFLLMMGFNSFSQTDFNALSEQLLMHIKNGQDTQSIQTKLKNTSLETLSNALKTDTKKLAFWINIYNAYIQILLQEDPDLYENRNQFFKKDLVAIAGRNISFDKIEHGIIRKSQWKLGMGYIRKWFPNKFERELRVNERDFRIHFAINCGAKDCPPVAIYSPQKLNDQLDKSTKAYLKKTTTYNAEENSVNISPLFKWFKGDFGCKSDVKDILKRFDVLKSDNSVKIKYTNYNWTLDLNNWTEL